MNYSGFRKTEEDDNKAVLKNKHGHTITIAKKALSPKHLEGLSRLPLHAEQGAGPIPAPPATPAPAPTEDDTSADDQVAQAAQDTSMPAQDASTPTQADQNVPVQAQAAPAQQTQDSGPPQASEDMTPATPAEHYANTMQDLDKNEQNWKNALDSGEIKPKTYQDMFFGHGVLAGIRNAFALLIGGAGAGLTHQPNAVMQLMDKQITNDLEAQKASKTNAGTFYQLNLQHELQKATIPKTLAEAKLISAEAANKAFANSKMQMNWAGLHDVILNNQNLPPGSADKAASDAGLGIIFPAINNENFNIKDRASAAAAMMRFSGQSNGLGDEQSFQAKNRMLRLSGQDKIADDNEAKHFPGLSGQSSTPLTPADRDMLDTGSKFDRQLSNFIDWTKNHSGDLSIADMREGRTLAAGLQGAYRQATRGGVYKEGEQNFISKIIDDNPTKFLNEIRVLPSLYALQQDNRNRLDQTAKNLGFQGYPGASNQAYNTQPRKQQAPQNVSSTASGEGVANAAGSNEKTLQTFMKNPKNSKFSKEEAIGHLKKGGYWH